MFCINFFECLFSILMNKDDKHVKNVRFCSYGNMYSVEWPGRCWGRN